MKPPRFEYWRPDRIDDVVRFLDDHADEAKLLAGGQSLMPMLNMRLTRPRYLIDLNGLGDLEYARVQDGTLRIGALTRQAALLRSSAVAEHCPLMVRALPHIGHTAIRHRGTIGGSLVHSDPSAELAAVAATLDAQMVVQGRRGSRTIPAAEFFVTFFTTAVEPTEVLTEVRLPVQPAGCGSSVMELSRRHGDFALSGVAAVVSLDGARIASARLTAFGVGEGPVRLGEVEDLLRGAEPADELIAEAGRRAQDAVEPESDMHASGRYRKEMTGVLTRRALAQAIGEAGGEIE